jgi:uncharacterized membrane protein
MIAAGVPESGGVVLCLRLRREAAGEVCRVSNPVAETPAVAPPLTGATGLLRSDRIVSVDLVRGIVMVIMALDHIRDYFTYLTFQAEDLTHTYGWLFFTRWITHFCAPTFFFLAGTGAYLSLGRGNTVGEISRFFWTRGLWLVVLEFTVLSFAWTFVPGMVVGFSVISCLGVCMMLMALLVRLPLKWLGGLGVAITALHNLADGVGPEQFGRFAWLWGLLHVPGPISIPGTKSFVVVLYALIPWVGVMAAGYAFGEIVRLPAAERQRIIFRIGAAATMLFVVLRAIGWYGNLAPDLMFGFQVSPGAWQHFPSLMLTLISFLNVAKYPPSLQYLLMTLGPMLMVLAGLDRLTEGGRLNRLGRWILVFGRVPLFYYVLHIFVVHLLAVLVALMSHQSTDWLLHGAFWAGPNPPGYGHGLLFIYGVWAVTIVLLYFPCAWFAGVKARRKDWWLSYL